MDEFNQLQFETSGNVKVDLYGICNRGEGARALVEQGFGVKCGQMCRKVKVGCFTSVVNDLFNSRLVGLIVRLPISVNIDTYRVCALVAEICLKVHALDAAPANEMKLVGTVEQCLAGE